MTRSLIHIAVVSLGLMLVAGCDDDSGTTTDTSGDTTLQETISGADWACLGNRVPDPPTQATLDFSMNVTDLVSRRPIDDVAIKVCLASDTTCASPASEVTTGADGTASFPLSVMPSGFVGYAELSKTGYVPLLLSANVPITDGPPTLPFEIWMVKASEIPTAAAVAGTTIDSTRGTLLVLAWDCAEVPAEGVTITASSADDNATAYFIVDASDTSTTAIASSTATMTDYRGAAGYFNLPAGAVTVETKRAADGVAIGGGMSEMRAGWVTGIIVVPTK